MKLKQSIATKMDEKYYTLKKNVYLHLCYLFLINYDYQNAIKHGNFLQRNFTLSPQGDFTLKQYLAEAYCMAG